MTSEELDSMHFAIGLVSGLKNDNPHIFATYKRHEKTLKWLVEVLRTIDTPKLKKEKLRDE